jgi:hypothetical protein
MAVVQRAGSYCAALLVAACVAKYSRSQFMALCGEGTAMLLRAGLAEALAVEEGAAVSGTDWLFADAAVGSQAQGPLPSGERVVCDVGILQIPVSKGEITCEGVAAHRGIQCRSDYGHVLWQCRVMHGDQ